MSRLKPLKPDERHVIRTLLAEFANSGHVDLESSEDEIWDQFVAAIGNLPDDFDVVIDHTPVLLSQARKARSEGNNELAVLMYATWVEHSLNGVLQKFAAERRMLQSHFTAMLREASLRAKATWLLPLLGARPLTAVTVARIQKLADARNAFIHYKWGQTAKAAKADQERAIVDAEKVVQTLQRLKRKEAKILSQRSSIIRKLVPT